jgi:predicted GNAT family acetyltransferase
MQVERVATVDEFLGTAGAFLAAREAEHNLMLGICHRLRDDPRLYGADPYFAAVVGAGSIVGAALRTPPHLLVLSELEDMRAADALCDDARDVFGELPGVVGPPEATSRFADGWRATTGASPHLAMRQRVYAAETATAPRGVTGRVRPYGPAERDLVLQWLDAFVAETGVAGPHEDPASVLDRRLAERDGGIVLWQDAGERTVSLAGFGSPTPNGIRIGPVYTPPEQRRRGYAGALVAAVTGDLLADGRRFCFLYTDLANPTSNSVYLRVGYRPVGDADQWSFDVSPSPTRR